MRRYGARHARERRQFDHWALWCERQWDESLGLPRITWLAKLVQYGERLGVMHAATEMPPPDHSDAEAVNTFMEWIRDACPPIHAALMARHRGICLERKAPKGERPRHGVERVYAECLLNDSSAAGVQRFRRLCEQGYRLYGQGAGRGAGGSVKSLSGTGSRLTPG